MDLVKQLEDKKKGCNTFLDEGEEYKDDIFDNEIHCGDIYKEKTYYCETCQAEIAILEQAIAEMQKQRQEVLKELDTDFRLIDFGFLLNKRDYKIITRFLDIIEEKQQLNQPKTEK